MTDPNTNDLLDLMNCLRSCFIKQGRWWKHKDSDGEWHDVGEDLQDFLEQLDEVLAAFYDEV